MIFHLWRVGVHVVESGGGILPLHGFNWHLHHKPRGSFRFSSLRHNSKQRSKSQANISKVTIMWIYGLPFEATNKTTVSFIFFNQYFVKIIKPVKTKVCIVFLKWHVLQDLRSLCIVRYRAEDTVFLKLLKNYFLFASCV